MSERADPISPTDTVLEVRRTGLIAFLLELESQFHFPVFPFVSMG